MMKAFFLIVLLLLPSTLFAASGFNPASVAQDVRFRLETFLPSDLDDVAKIRVLRASDPLNYVYQFALGVALTKKAYYSVAPKGYINAAQIPGIVRRVKSSKKIKGYLDEAMGYLDDVLERDDRRFCPAYFVRGVVYLIQGRNAEALADFYASMGTDVENVMSQRGAYIALSLIWNKLSKEQKATWSVDVAGRMAERLSVAQNKTSEDYLLTTRLYRGAEEFERAMVMTELGLQKDPSDKRLLTTRSRLFSIGR